MPESPPAVLDAARGYRAATEPWPGRAAQQGRGRAARGLGGHRRVRPARCGRAARARSRRRRSPTARSRVRVVPQASDQASGTVLSSTPGPGSPVRTGDVVVLTVASGSSGSPDLTPFALQGKLIIVDPVPPPVVGRGDITLEIGRRLQALLEASSASTQSTRSVIDARAPEPDTCEEGRRPAVQPRGDPRGRQDGTGRPRGRDVPSVGGGRRSRRVPAHRSGGRSVARDRGQAGPRDARSRPGRSCRRPTAP